MALSRNVFDIFDIKEYDLEIRITVTQGHRRWHHSIACIWFPIRAYRPIETLSLKWPFSRYGDILLERLWKTYHTLIWHVSQGWPLAKFSPIHIMQKVDSWGFQSRRCTFHDTAFALICTIPARDGQTDGHVAVAKTAVCIPSRV